MQNTENDNFKYSDNEFKNIISKITLSNPNCRIVNNPFFIQNSTSNIIDITKNIKLSEKEQSFLSLFPEHFRTIYEHVDQTTEINVGSFTLFSLKTIMSRLKKWEDFIDIGVKYAGMGHVFVISMERDSQLFFFRTDGGSNGYDREENYKKYKNISLTNSKKMMNFDKLIDIIINNKNFISNII